MKKLTLSLLIISSIMIACQKTENIEPTTPKNTIEVVAPSNFDWKTTKEVTLKIIGMKDINPNIKNQLYVKSSDEKIVYYNDIINMNFDYTIIFSVPSTETNIIIEYGSKSQRINLLTNDIIYDYIVQ